MTNKDDEELADALSDFLVPWDWEDVILQDFNDDYFLWCKAQGLIFGKDFYLHIDEVKVNPKSIWPFPERTHDHHYLFKDPVNATAFRLTFLT